MCDREKARARAHGALDNFFQQMGEEIKEKSDNYKEEFWEALALAMQFEAETMLY